MCTVRGYFTTRDLAYVSVTTVMVYVVAFVAIMSVSAFTAFPGAKSIASAFFTAIVLALGAMRVRKIGVMSFVTLLWGLISAFLFPAVPILLPATLSGGVAADILVFLLRKDYSSESATTIACGVRSGVSTLVVLLLVLVFGSSSLRGAPLIFQLYGATLRVQAFLMFISLAGVPPDVASLFGVILTVGVLGAFMPNLGVPGEIVAFAAPLLKLLGVQAGGVEAVLTPSLIVVISALCFALGAAGGYVGARIGRELKLAGVYR
ncbi:MAG: MptD family putative ECF transporter S component [Candidatus Jordarchaeales archaeon]